MQYVAIYGLMVVSLIHTAQVHCASFDALRDQIAPDQDIHHIVRPDWLERAQNGIDADLRSEISETIRAADGNVLCTCSTIGAVAETSGALRIDWPMMQVAAKTGGPVLLVYCLESTVKPSSLLLERAIAEHGGGQCVFTLDLSQSWALFVSGDIGGFSSVISKGVRNEVARRSTLTAVVLAQASMACATTDLADLSIPVLSSPRLALKTLLGLTDSDAV